MRRYLFHLREETGQLTDISGTELETDAAAVQHGYDVVCELMKNRERQTRHWRLEIYHESRHCASIPFAVLDPTLDHLSPEARKLVERSCEKCLSLVETILSTRRTLRTSRSLVARSRRKPYLISDQWGEEVLHP